MQIQNLTLNNTSQQKISYKNNNTNNSTPKCDNSIKDVPNSFYRPLNFGGEIRVYDPMEEIRKEKELRENLFNQFMVEQKDFDGNTITDKQGRPITKLDPKIKKMLDSTTFEFTAPNGSKMNCTIKDAINAYIVDTLDEDAEFQGVIHGSSLESINDIINNGPDMRKTSTSAFGPGMYFAFSEGDAHDYSSAKLMADIIPQRRENGEKGKIVRFNTNFYDKINNHNLHKAITDFTGLEAPDEAFQPYYIERAYMELPSKLVDEYCRDLMVEEMGIDAAQCGARGFHSCAVVLNPDAITNIQEFNPYRYY